MQRRAAGHSTCLLGSTRRFDALPRHFAPLQYAATLPAMLEFADSRKWVFWHDQVSGKQWPVTSRMMWALA